MSTEQQRRMVALDHHNFGHGFIGNVADIVLSLENLDL
jgi:hypothetical protein